MKKMLFAAALLGMCLPLFGCSSQRQENELAYRQMGINYLNDGEYASAVEAFDKALSEKIGMVSDLELDICYYKGLSQYKAGDAKSAIETYSAIIDYKKKLPDAYYLRGCVYANEGDNAKAIADFEKAIDLSDDYEMYLNVANTLKGADDADDAVGYYSYIVENTQDASSGEELYYRGLAHMGLGEFDTAKEELDTYLESNPTDVTVLNEIGVSLMDAKSYSKAIEYFNKALEAGEDADLRMIKRNLISALEYTGDFDGAYKQAKEYNELYPSDAEVERELVFLETRKSDDSSNTEKKTSDEP